jgi:TorA maturation chaperone TorD
MENDILLSDIYAQLSEFFKGPTEEFASDVADGRLLSYFREVYSVLGINRTPPEGLWVTADTYAVLRAEYKKLFMGPLPPYIVPVESVYKRWSNDPGCNLPLAGEKGYLMGDPAMDMISRYQADGLVIPDEYSAMPDHIILELEYMAHLCRNFSEREQREFLKNHLDWIADLTGDIQQYDNAGFYFTAVQITELVNKAVQRELNRSCIPEQDKSETAGRAGGHRLPQSLSEAARE